MDQDVLYFFDGKPEGLPLYEAFEERVFSEVDGARVKVQKMQIAFSNRRQFAFASFLPVSAEWNRCFLKRRYKQKAECLRAVCARKLGYDGGQECRKYGAGGAFYGK